MEMNYPNPIMPNEGSQEFTVLTALKTDGSLTPLESWQRYGIYALSQRIGRLKHKYHWKIEGEIVPIAETKQKFKRYWLAA